MNFEAKDRVSTPMGPGAVVYKRMAPPTYSEVESYSVVLDARKDQPNYHGTIFQASQVQSIDTNSRTH